MKSLKNKLSSVILHAMKQVEDNFNFYLENIYAAARQLWQAVDWPKDNFADYLAGRQLPCATDMYLAGAAAYRLDSAWSTIDSQLKGKVQAKLAYKPRADMTVDELWAETYFKLLKEDTKHDKLPDGRYPAAIIGYGGKIKLTSYMLLAAARIAIDRNRKRKPQSMPTDGEDNVIAQPSNTANPEDEAQEAELAGKFAELIAKGLQKLDSEQHFLLKAVFRDGIKQTRLAKVMGVKDYEISRRIARAVGLLRESIETLSGLQLTTETLNAWQQAWNEHCDLQENSEKMDTEAQK